MADGWDFEDVELSVRDWIDVSGVHHDVDEDPSNWPSDADLQDADMVNVTIIYPTGESDTRWFAGPFDDWNDLLFDIEDWFDEGS